MQIERHRIISFDNYKEFYKYLKKHPVAKSGVTYKTGQYWYPADEDYCVRFILADMSIGDCIEEIKIPLRKIPRNVFLKDWQARSK